MMLPMQEKALDVQALKYSKLLSTSVQDDAHHRVVDETKKRAAGQNVDYDTFAAMVSVAHLKPIDRRGPRELNEVSRKGPAFRFDAQGNVVNPLHAYAPVVSHLHLNIQASPRENKPLQDDSTCVEGNYLKQLKANGCLEELPLLQQRTNSCPKSPSTIMNTEISSSFIKLSSHVQGSLEVSTNQAYSNPPNYKLLTRDGFERKWRKFGKDAYRKSLLLRQIAPASFPIIFKVEIPPNMLAEILEILYMYTLSVNSKLEQAVDEFRQQESELEILGSTFGNNAITENEALSKISHEGMLPQLCSSTSKQINQIGSRSDLASDKRPANSTASKDLVDLSHLCNTLTCLAKSGRFPLSVKLISKQAQQCASRLFDYLAHEFKEERSIVNNLKSLYLQRT